MKRPERTHCRRCGYELVHPRLPCDLCAPARFTREVRGLFLRPLADLGWRYFKARMRRLRG